MDSSCERRLYLVPQDIMDSWTEARRMAAVQQPGEADVRRRDADVRSALTHAADMSAHDRNMHLNHATGAFLEAHKAEMTRRAGPPPGKVKPYVSLEAIPKTFRGRAEALLEAWRRDPAISWDDQNRVSVGGETIQGSNVVDLLGDAVRARKTVPHPPGFEILRERSISSNIPRALLGNPSWSAGSPSLPAAEARPVSEPWATDYSTAGEAEESYSSDSDSLYDKEYGKRPVARGKFLKQWEDLDD